MKFWEKFSRSIYKIGAQHQLNKIRPKLLEPVLRKSVLMLNDEMISEIRTFIVSQQTDKGGFSDRGGKTDLYYTLFGLYIAEAFSVNEVMEQLKLYVKEVVEKNNLSGVFRYCGAILYAKMIGLNDTTEKLRKEIVAELTETTLKQPEYSGFLGILALYYLEDFVSIKRIVNQYKRIFRMKGNHPCPVVAANTVIQGFSGGQSQESADKLQSFHRTDSGFAALHHAPAEDLLSTGVALFALNFLSADLRLIKPDCLNFVDELYDCGGFRSTQADSITDVEYTFYGLLALGSMC